VVHASVKNLSAEAVAACRVEDVILARIISPLTWVKREENSKREILSVSFSPVHDHISSTQYMLSKSSA